MIIHTGEKHIECVKQTAAEAFHLIGELFGFIDRESFQKPKKLFLQHTNYYRALNHHPSVLNLKTCIISPALGHNINID